MNVVEAIKRSCNTWFYQAGLATGASKVVGMAERMGFGQPTGIPLPGENKGFVPTDAYYMQRYGHKSSQAFYAPSPSARSWSAVRYRPRSVWPQWPMA